MCVSPGKHPRTSNGVKDASNDEAVVQAWMDRYPHTNWGLACGSDSGILAIDIDPTKDGDQSFTEFEAAFPEAVPPTLVALTGGGGRHLIYAIPGSTHIGNPTNWLPGVDIRGKNGYIVVEPSRHVSGGVYEWLDWSVEPAMAPRTLVDSITGQTTRSQYRRFGDGFGASVGLPSTDAILQGVQQGSRDDALFRLACRLRRQLNDSRAAVEHLVLAAAASANPPFERKDALRKVDQAFTQNHTDDDIFSSTSVFTDEEADNTITAEGVEEPIFRMTDVGNRNRFVKEFGNDFRYVEGFGWHTWTDIGWVSLQSDLEVQEAAKNVSEIARRDATMIADLTARQRMIRWADESESSGRISALMKLAKSHPTIHKSATDFDSSPSHLACRNGMVDLRTGEIRSFKRSDMTTRNTGVMYDPDALLPAWEQFLYDTTQGDQELIEYLQMSAGYSLTGSVAEESFFIISGRRASGKSTYLDGLHAALGKYADTVAAETFIKKYSGKGVDRDELVKFVGSRLITTTELPEGERFDEAFIKKITGGDPLSARYLYQEAFTFKPQFKLWMATNHDPITTDSAMFRRIKRVPFPHTVPAEKRDMSLKERIKDPKIGGVAVLAWAVKGAIKYFERGRLVTPDTVVNSTSAYEQEQNDIQHFMREVFWWKDGAQIEVRVAHLIYREWAKQHGEKLYRRTSFVQRLRDNGVTLGRNDRGELYIANMMLRRDQDITIMYRGSL